MFAGIIHHQIQESIMSITLNPTANGRMPRKNLSDQLDRLDRILDGLDGALAGAITEAVKDAVSTSVAEAVRVTLIEIVTNPDVIALLRGGSLAAFQASPKVAARVTVVDRIRQGVSAAWKWSLRKLKAIGLAITTRARSIRAGVVGTVRSVNMVWRLKRPLLIALGVGSVMGAVAYASSPWMAAILSGIAATGATLGAQLALWTRRLFASFSMR
jgi:hypothetical protein